MATEVSLPKPPERVQSSTSRIEDSEVSLLDVLIVLAERKRTILWVSAVFAIVAIVVSLVLPKRYTATATLLPPQQNSSMAGALAAQLGNLSGMAAITGGSLGIKNPNDMFVAMLRSRTVEDAMVNRFGLLQEYHVRYQSDGRKEFERRSSVDAAGKDGLIHISVDDRNPERAALLANSYVDQFRRLSESLAITEASQRRLFFQQQLEQAKNNLADAEEAMKRTEQETGLIQLDSQARALIESAASLRAQIAAKEVQIKSLETFATDQNSQLVQAQQELLSMQAQLAKLGGSEAGAEATLLVPNGRVPEAGLKYLRRLRDVKYNETIFEILARQFEVAKLDEAKQGALVQVVDSAVVPDKPSFPKKTLIVIGATAVGLIVGLCLALLQAGYQRLNYNSKMSEKMAIFRRSLSFRRTTLVDESEILT